MGTFVQRTLNVAKEIEQDVVHAPEVITTLIEQKITDPVISSIKNVVQYVDREIIQYVEVPITVEKEVIKFVDREIKVMVEVPTYITKEIEKIVEVPVEVIHNIDRKVITLVNKVPNWCWLFMGAEILLNLILIIK